MKLTTFDMPGSLDPSYSRNHTLIDDVQDLCLNRADLGFCALGTKGNLQFTAREGATAPASRAGVLLSEMRRSLADKLVSLKFKLTREPSEARAQHAELVRARDEVRSNSRRIGDLLGSLTAKVDQTAPMINARDHSRIVQALLELNLPSERSIYSLKGAKYSLDIYLNELKESDLVALSHGLLSNEEACKAFLDQISTRHDDALRMQASQVLGDVAEAVNKQVLRYAVHKPLWQVLGQLNASRMDGQKLHEQLLKLSDNEPIIFKYFHSLYKLEFMEWLRAFQSERMDAAREALLQVADESRAKSLSVLDSINNEVNLRFPAWAPPGLRSWRVSLSRDLLRRDGPAVAHDLYQLSRQVEFTCQNLGGLPSWEVRAVQQLVEASMDLFRDQQNNPVGPLNAHSRSKLDDSIRADLYAAAPVLHRYGLVLA